MKCQIYIVVDRQPVSVTTFSTNLGDLPPLLSGDVAVSKWKVQLEMWEGLSQTYIDIEDVDYPISIQHDFTGNSKELQGVRFSRDIGSGTMTLEFIFAVETIVPMDILDVHATFSLS